MNIAKHIATKRFLSRAIGKNKRVKRQLIVNIYLTGDKKNEDKSMIMLLLNYM